VSTINLRSLPLVFIDCEAYGGCPRTGQLTEFGAVDYRSRTTFHGLIVPSRPSAANPAVPEPLGPVDLAREKQVFENFADWLSGLSGRSVMVSDNPAFDYQWINDGFWRYLGRNPLGHSARRISDFYAGLTGDFHNTQRWKRLRVTPHDHNPVHDAMGNLEAFEKLMAGQR
jgi:DNA polymerase III epsilon subunit-like protein